MRVKQTNSGISAFQVSLRAGTAAALSVVVAHLLGLEFPLYALIAAIIVTDLSAQRTRQLGLQRLIGTIIGAALGAAVSTGANHLAHVGPLIIAVGVFAAMLLSNLLGLKDAAKLAGYVCGIVLLDHNAHPWSYALYRLVETVIGIGAAVGISLIPKLLKIDELTRDPDVR
jgi:uncharacterized membrane protein YgaE (UPF0421/DUF939 family)